MYCRWQTIENAVDSVFTPDYTEWNCRLRCGFIPVRNDGLVGEVVFSEPGPIVIPDRPCITGVDINGKLLLQGAKMTAVVLIEGYTGGFAYQW